jgi:hypothetical protein
MSSDIKTGLAMNALSPKTIGKCLGAAYDKATESPDKSTQNGAIIRGFIKTDAPVPCSPKIYGACNKLPANTPDSVLDDRATKYQHIRHAEYAATMIMMRAGRNPNAFIMYAPWAACEPCGRIIADSDLGGLVIWKTAMAKTPERWQEAIRVGLGLVLLSNVPLYMYAGPVQTEAGIMFDGDLWFPGKENTNERSSCTRIRECPI